MMISAVGSGKGLSSARMRGSTCPCGQTSGRERIASYSSRAMERTPGSESKYRSSERTSSSAARTAGAELVDGVMTGVEDGGEECPCLYQRHPANLFRVVTKGKCSWVAPNPLNAAIRARESMSQRRITRRDFLRDA